LDIIALKCAAFFFGAVNGNARRGKAASRAHSVLVRAHEFSLFVADWK